MSIGLTLQSLRSETFDVSQMSDATLVQYVKMLCGIENEKIRDVAATNKSLASFIATDRFLIEYARETDQLSKLPPQTWLQEQMENDGFMYTHEQQKKSDKFRFDLQEIVFNKTRHGFKAIDVPFETLHGVHPFQNTADCTSPVPLNNVFVFGNLNLPVLRFDPSLFCQNWIMSLIRPKWIFRGMIACPQGDYGLVNISVEVHNSRNGVSKKTITIPFKQNDDDVKGRFMPFEVCSDDYQFRPYYVFVSVMVFHVSKTHRQVEGIRVANCTIQCVLPEQVVPLAQDNVLGMPSSSHDPPLSEHLSACLATEAEPDYARKLREAFYAPITNSLKLRDEDTARREREMEAMMCGDLMGEQEHMEVVAEARKRREPGQDEGEPEQKRQRV